MTDTKAFHEDFGRGDEPKAGSECGFGMVFAFVFAVIGLWPLWDGGGIRLWALIAACVFAAAGLFTPALLRPLNRVWFLFGMVLHKVVNHPERIEALIGAGAAVTREPVKPGEVGGMEDLISADGDLRTLPCHLPEQGGMDGFYAARLIKA